jgi:hypothetical protein
VRAVLASLDVTAERRRAAALNRRHDLQLTAHMTGVSSAPRRSVAAQAIGSAGGQTAKAVDLRDVPVIVEIGGAALLALSL